MTLKNAENKSVSASELIVGMFVRFARDPESENSEYLNAYQRANGNHSPTTEGISIPIGALHTHRCVHKLFHHRHNQLSSRTCLELV